MSIEALKQVAHEKMGIPSNLLTGQTEEEVLEQVRQIAAFKKQRDSEFVVETPKSTREQFAAWLNGDPEPAAPHREVVPGYPDVQDAGEVDLGDQRPAREKFADWFEGVSASNPWRHDPDGWKRIV